MDVLISFPSYIFVFTSATFSEVDGSKKLGSKTYQNNSLRWLTYNAPLVSSTEEQNSKTLWQTTRIGETLSKIKKIHLTNYQHLYLFCVFHLYNTCFLKIIDIAMTMKIWFYTSFYVHICRCIMENAIRCDKNTITGTRDCTVEIWVLQLNRSTTNRTWTCSACLLISPSFVHCQPGSILPHRSSTHDLSMSSDSQARQGKATQALW